MQIRWYHRTNKTLLQVAAGLRPIRLFPLSLLLLSGCVQLNLGHSPDHPGVLPVADSRQLPRVITDLIQQADQQFLQGDYNESLATLERAIRIKPRYPEVWSRMAQVYLHQGKFPQTRQHAERSNSYIKNNQDLMYFNNKLIHMAREGIQP